MAGSHPSRTPLSRNGLDSREPIGSAAELAELVGHAARRLRRDSLAHLAPLGLTMAQARVLRSLAHGELRMADIAARLDVVPRTVTPMVDGLESAQLVSRRTDHADRRSVLVGLTGRGEELLEQLDDARRRGAERVFGALNEAQRHQLSELLGAVCEAHGCPWCAHDQGER